MPQLSARMQRNAPLIIALNQASSTVRNAALAAAKKDLIMALVECAKNIILGVVNLSPAQFTALRQHRKDIERLVARKTTTAKRRKILQKGGFLASLIGPALGVLGGLLRGITNRR